MLTVEELVIESLYHRLVLISVKKLGASSPGSDQGTSLTEEVDDEAPASPSALPSAPAGLSSTGTGGGLGFLVLNSLCPQIRRAYGMAPTFSLTQNLDQESGAGKRSMISQQSSITEDFMVEHGFEVSEEVEMILGTSEIQLMKTTLRSPELQVEMPPTWHFGSSLSYDMSSVSPDADDNSRVLMPRGVSLDNCHQFSIVKLEDKRDPSCHSLVLVQTNEGDGTGERRLTGAGEHDSLVSSANVLCKAKSLSEAESTGRGTSRKLTRQKASVVMPVPMPVLTTNNMSVFVQQGTDDDVGMDSRPEAESQESVAELVTRTDSEQIRERVADLLQGLESQVSPEGSPKKLATNGRDKAMVTPDQLVIRERDKESASELVDGKAFTMSGSYKMFNITGNTDCVLTSLEPPPEGIGTDQTDSRPSTLVSGPMPVTRTVTKPVAEVEFSVEAGETQLEQTISAIKDIKCQFNSSLPISLLGMVYPQSPMKDHGHGNASNGPPSISDAAENGISFKDTLLEKSRQSMREGDDLMLNGFGANNDADGVKLGAESLTEAFSNQNGIPDSAEPSVECDNEGLLSSSKHPWDSSKKVVGLDEEPVSPSGYLPKQNGRGGRELASARSGSTDGLTSPPPYEWRRRVPEDPSMESMYYTPPESPDYEVRFGRACSPLSGRGAESRGGTRPASSPRRRGNDSGLSLALQPPSRILTYRDPASPMDSHSDLSDSFMMTESSDGDELASLCELDLPYDVPAYMRHPDWMSDLPASVYTKPLTELIIPGSHISLAIDREMRMDMDFSKCSYEMAEFLRKLPNLAIFNSFRGLMKKIWKAWMPKQTLTVAQQLDAGVRYLDLRVTKLRGSLYGEHGLYTRPLKRYLKEIKEFLDEHWKEVIILHFQTLDQLQVSDKRHLVTALFQAFGARLARVGVPGKTTLEALWKNKKQVIVIFPDEDMSSLRNHIFYGLVWSDFEIVAPYPNNLSIDDLKAYLDLMDGDASSLKAAAIDEKFHVVKAVLSPDMTMVFGEFKHRSMREMTENETEEVVMEWIRTNPKRKLNIIALDFVGTGMAVSNIVQLNFPGCETVV